MKWEHDIDAEPFFEHNSKLHGPLAQLVEQQIFNLLVGGSIPSRPINCKSIIKYI